MEKAIWKKGLVISTIAIFCSLAVMPAIATLNTPRPRETYVGIYKWKDVENNDGKEEFIEVEVNEHNSDGRIETKRVTLTTRVVNELKQALLTARTSEERFSILKGYGLVPSDTKLEDLAKGMYAKAETMGLTGEKTQKFFRHYKGITDLRLPLLLTFFSHVDAVYFLGNSLRMGVTPITMLINRLFGTNIQGVDLFDVCWGAFGIISARGALGFHSMVCMPSFMITAGFVGYSVKFPIAYHIFSGYSIMTFAAGIGFHDFQPIS